jgi:hypothetical protein
MKKQIPIPVVIVVVLAVIGIAAFVYSRAPIEQPPPLANAPKNLAHNPHDDKVKLMQKNQRAKKAKADAASPDDSDVHAPAGKKASG